MKPSTSLMFSVYKIENNRFYYLKLLFPALGGREKS